MTIKDLIYKAKVKLQELTPYGSGLAVLDPLSDITTPITDGLVVLEPSRYDKPVEIYIRACIEESYGLLVDLAPSNLLPSKPFDKSIVATKNQNGSGYIVLPNDFHSLNRLKMVGWERPVTSTVNSSSPEYNEQFNDYIRGGFSTPKCTIIKIGIERRLEYYSLPTFLQKHEIDFGYYIPKLNINGDDEIDIDDRLISVLIYLIVSRVQLIYEQIQLSEKTKQTAIEELEIIKSKL